MEAGSGNFALSHFNFYKAKTQQRESEKKTTNRKLELYYFWFFVLVFLISRFCFAKINRRQRDIAATRLSRRALQSVRTPLLKFYDAK
jgi:hypothetical protein